VLDELLINTVGNDGDLEVVEVKDFNPREGVCDMIYNSFIVPGNYSNFVCFVSFQLHFPWSNLFYPKTQHSINTSTW
jgi:hypothetical protein